MDLTLVIIAAFEVKVAFILESNSVFNRNRADGFEVTIAYKSTRCNEQNLKEENEMCYLK